jgi:hypothetical protein
MITTPMTCQNDNVKAYTKRYPKILFLLQRAREYGLWGTIRWILAKIGLSKKEDHREEIGDKIRVTWEENLNLQPGDLVEVRPESEIRATLDENGKYKGLVLMTGMPDLAGKRFRVYKRLERILIENTGEIRKVKNTVLLDGAICDGFSGACHKSCFFYWREIWLRKIESD